MPYPPGVSCSMVASTSAAVSITSGVASASGLPPGLAFPGIYGADSISGTPTLKGIYQSTINGLGVTWQVTAPGPTWGWTPDPFHVNNLVVGTPSNIQLIPTGGPPTGAVTFGMMATIFPYCSIPGSLPPGLTLQSDGHVTGTPTVAGSYAASVYGLDTNFQGGTGSNNLQILVSGGGGGALSAACGSPPQGTVGVSYTHAFIASGGTPPYVWTAISLPPGLSLSSGGILSGIPSASGPYIANVDLSDSAGGGPIALTCTITILAAGGGGGSVPIPIGNLPLIPLPNPAVCR